MVEYFKRYKKNKWKTHLFGQNATYLFQAKSKMPSAPKHSKMAQKLGYKDDVTYMRSAFARLKTSQPACLKSQSLLKRLKLGETTSFLKS